MTILKIMEFKSFQTGTNDSQRRLDKVIRKFIPEAPLSSIYKYIRKGLIKVNQKKTTADYHIQQGDEIQIAAFILDDLISENTSNDEPVTINEKLPNVVFRNEHILILDKPYDITVHGNSNSLDSIVKKAFPPSDKTSLSFTPGPLHRLDRKTTGLLAFSQSLQGAQWFSKNIQTHEITKKYFAVLQGKLLQEEEWKDSIAKTDDETANGFHLVKETEDGNLAHTIAKPLAYGQYNKMDFTLAELEIKTGRTHQIRVQSSIHGHPLLGDTAYKGTELSVKYPDFFLQAFLLHFPKNNPVGLPEEIKIDFSTSLKTFLKDCDVTVFGV